jgi:hypothetical protein
MTPRPSCATPVLAALILAACATARAPTVTSTTWRRAAEPPRRIFLLARLDQSLPDAFEHQYVAALGQELSKLGATVQAVELTGLELDRRAPAESRAAFAPDQVLIVRFSVTSSTDAALRGFIELRLLDAHDSALWAARQGFTYVSLFGGGASGDGTRAGAAAIQKLIADRVFPGAA